MKKTASAHTAKKPAKKKPSVKKIELDPEAWPKFEALVKSAAKMGHKPHAEKPKRAK